MHGRSGKGALAGGVATLLALALLALPSPTAAQSFDSNCLTTNPPPPSKPAQPLRFGITPLAAGNVGSGQGEPKPVRLRAERAALRALRPGRKQLVMRLNRMFMADGVPAIRRYAKLVDRYARWGFDSELQVRYHPRPEQEGRMKPWRRFVRKAALILGRRPSLKALSITNEANFDISPNTSDGSYEGVRRALVQGVVVADRVLRRHGRRDVELGFSFAWRYLPDSDRDFWEEIGRRATPRFKRALDYVGLQIYPHLVWPPAPLPGRTAGDEVVEALTLLRGCYMPKAGLGRRVDVWVSENGYATNLGRDEAGQRRSLATTLKSLHRYSGELGLTDYRWFNLRDNDTGGLDLFDAVGVLRDDYSRKPAFSELRRGIARFGKRRR
jgi:hypothetical protein